MCWSAGWGLDQYPHLILNSVHPKPPPFGSGAPRAGGLCPFCTDAESHGARKALQRGPAASRLGAVLQGCQATRGDLLQRPHRERRTRGPPLFIGRLEEDHAPFPTALLFDWLSGPGWPRLLPSRTQESRAFQLETWHAEGDSGPHLPAHFPCHWCGTPTVTTPPFQPPGWEGGHPLLIGWPTCHSRERLAFPSLPSLLPRAGGSTAGPVRVSVIQRGGLLSAGRGRAAAVLLGRRCLRSRRRVERMKPQLEQPPHDWLWRL